MYLYGKNPTYSTQGDAASTEPLRESGGVASTGATRVSPAPPPDRHSIVSVSSKVWGAALVETRKGSSEGLSLTDLLYIGTQSRSAEEYRRARERKSIGGARRG